MHIFYSRAQVTAHSVKSPVLFTAPTLLLKGLLLAGLIASSTTSALAQSVPVSAVPVTKLHALEGNAYWLEGVANTGFVVGTKSVLVIEAQRNDEAAKEQIAQVAKVTSLPISQLVMTHADPDSVGGALAYPAGTSIIAHENTGPQILAGAADAEYHPIFGPIYRAIATRLPDHTIAQSKMLPFDGAEIILLAAAPAHTGADIAVYLPAQKVLFAGDIISTNTGPYPVVHRASGGTSQGWLVAMEALLALDAKLIIPGHGPIETRQQLEQRLRDARERREQVKQLVGQHKTLAQIRSILHDEQTSSPFRSYVEIIYSELTEGYPAAKAPWSNRRSPPAQ